MKRRQVLSRSGAIATGSLAALGISSSTASAASDREAAQPEAVTTTYNESLINEYKPSLVLENVNPRPVAFHALHAESSESDLNAVYGFALYAYQDGASRHDSHLGDHEPFITWYDATTGDVARVDYAGYHWFRDTRLPEALEFADDANHRPLIRVDPTYHHYYPYSGGLPGSDVPIENLLESIDSWLANGLESELALSQPYNPYRMLSRRTWWKHTTRNWVDAYLKALYFNLGISGAAETSELGEARTW